MENTQLTTETLSLMTLGALPGVGLKTLRTILIRYDSAMAALEALAQGLTSVLARPKIWPRRADGLKRRWLIAKLTP